MIFNADTLKYIDLRPYSYFLVEDGSPGFAVKVQPSGSVSFYYRKKINSKRIDIPLGIALDVARLKYHSHLARENQLQLRQSTSGLSSPSSAASLHSSVPVDHVQLTVNPLYYSGITFGELVARFMTEHVHATLRPATARNYAIYLDKVQKDLAASMIVSGNIGVDLARQELKTYIHSMKLSTPTQANRIRETLSSCFKWGVYEDLCYASPVYGIRVFKEVPKTRRFTQAELPEFFRVLREGDYGWRSAHCLRLILATGLRASEALSIKPEDIDWQNSTLLIPQTKSGEPFIVPLTPLTTRLLRECCANQPTNRPLFNTSIWGIRQVCKRVCNKAGITSCSTHDLRRTFATLLGELGVNVPVISRCLNHSAGGSVTTRVYALHSMLDEKREALHKVADRLTSFGCLLPEMAEGEFNSQ